MRPKLSLGLAVLGLGSALVSTAAVAQDTMQSRQRNYQDSRPQVQQQNYQDTRSQGPNDRDTLQSRQRQAMEPNGEETRSRGTHRVTVIRRTARRPTARMENTAGDENTEYLRSAAGPSNVAQTAPPPQRQSYGWNGPAGGNGDYYDRYGDNGFGGYGDNGFGNGEPGFAANAGYGETAAMDQDSIAACRMRFRSFDPASGTFLGFDGARHPCP